MRFAIAAGILANTLPASSGESFEAAVASSPKNRLEALLHNSDGKSNPPFEKKIRKNGNSLASRYLQRGSLKNLHVPVQECSPTSDHADLGMLSCGPNMICEQRNISKLGGICVQNPAVMDRNLQDENVGIGYNFCNPASRNYGMIDCDCTEFDSAANVGSLSCREERCFEEYSDCCADTCGSTTLEYALDSSGALNLESCTDFTLPYEQSFCYRVTNDQTIGGQTCGGSFNGNECSSCSVQSGCALLDCENVGLGDEFCLEEFYPPVLESCACLTPCPLCPNDDEVSYPDLIVGQNLTCGYLNSVGLPPSIECDYFVSIVQDVCCITMSDAPTPSTSAGPEPTPVFETDAPSESLGSSVPTVLDAEGTPSPSMVEVVESVVPTDPPGEESPAPDDSMAPTAFVFPLPASLAPSAGPIGIAPTSPPTVSCSVRIQTGQCEDFLIAEAESISCDCSDKCIAFVDGIFAKCDNGQSISGSGLIVAGCFMAMAPEGTFDCDNETAQEPTPVPSDSAIQLLSSGAPLFLVGVSSLLLVALSIS